MNKAIKTILITSIALLGAGVLFASPAQATPPNLEVEFQNDPLFSEANFMPGDGISRWVKVTNNTPETQPINTWAINVDNSDNLGDVLYLEIKEGGTSLYNDTFTNFFNAGQVYLSNLAGNSTQTQYDFIATFNPVANNDYQGKTLGFDIVVGFPGEGQCTDNDGDGYYAEGGECGPADCNDSNPGINPGAAEICNDGVDNDCDGYTDCSDNDCYEYASCLFQPTGGGGGGGLIILNIFNETNGGVSTFSVTVAWYTNIPATSRVIYDTVPHGSLGSPPNYGYAFSTVEDPTKVTYHEVTITGLVPGTTYYWRAISHGSPEALGKELSFTTPVEETGPEVPPETPPGIPPVTPPTGGGPEAPGGGVEGEGGESTVQGEGGEIVIGPGEEEEPGFGFGNLLAAIGSFALGNYCWLLALIMTILTALLLLSQKKNSKIEEKKKYYWLSIFAIVVLIVLAILMKCLPLIIPIIILIIFLLRERFE